MLIFNHAMEACNMKIVKQEQLKLLKCLKHRAQGSELHQEIRLTMNKCELQNLNPSLRLLQQNHLKRRRKRPFSSKEDSQLRLRQSLVPKFKCFLLQEKGSLKRTQHSHLSRAQAVKMSKKKKRRRRPHNHLTLSLISHKAQIENQPEEQQRLWTNCLLRMNQV